MTASFGALFGSFFLPVAAGFVSIRLLFFPCCLPLLFSLSLAYGLGLGFITLWMLILNICGLSHSLSHVALPLALYTVIAAIALLFKTAHYKKNQLAMPYLSLDASTDAPKTSLMQKFMTILLIIYILGLGLYLFWRSFHIPIFEFDPIKLISFKAKIFFFEESLHQISNLPHQAYPLHVPLAQTWIALNLQSWEAQCVKALFPFTFLSFITVFFYFIRSQTNSSWALSSIALLMTSSFFNFHATISYLDFTLMSFNVITLILLCLWQTKGQTAWMITAAISAGLSSFTKLEGMTFLAVYLTLILFALWRHPTSASHKIKTFLLFAGLSLLPLVLFEGYKASLGVAPDETALQTDINYLERLLFVMKRFAEEMVLSGNWNILWFMLGVSLWNAGRILKENKHVQLLLLGLVLYLGLYALTFLITNNFVWLKQDTTLPRLFLHFYPLVPILIVLINYQKFYSNVRST